MDDMSGHGRPQQDSDQLRHTLSIADVGRELQAAGVPRSDRQIKRYCQTSALDGIKVPGPSGDQWYVAPVSVPKLIGDLRQWEAQKASHGRPWPATSDSSQHENARKDNADTAGHGLLKPAMSEADNKEEQGTTGEDTAGHVRQLEMRIEEKDDQIRFLRDEIATKNRQITDASERARETNVLIRGLQNLVLQLQAPRQTPRGLDDLPPDTQTS